VAGAQTGAAVALVGGRVYVSASQPPVENGVIILANGVIVAAGDRTRISVPADATIIDCTGQTVMPAFWNSHVHFTESRWAEVTGATAGAVQASLDAMLLRYGFAHVMDTGAPSPTTAALKRLIAAGQLRGPTILASGLPFVPPSGTPVYVEPLKLPELASAAQARLAVRARIQDEGSDAIKLMTTSITRQQPFPSMSDEVVAAAVDEAHRLGHPVLAHPTNLIGLTRAVRNGVDVLLHTTPDSGDWSAEIVAEMKRRNVALVPTLKLWDEVLRLEGRPLEERRRFQASGIRQLRAFAKAGGTILFGTDVGFVTDYDPSAEYVAMREAGLSFAQILESLTAAPAKQFRLDTVTGTLEPGKHADIVVVAGNPAADLAALQRVVVLYRQGRVVWHQDGPRGRHVRIDLGGFARLGHGWTPVRHRLLGP
jgi:imidazolonepropionase-like amidohydrolase